MATARMTLDQIEARANQHEHGVALLAADELLAANGYAYVGAPCLCPDGGEAGHRLTCGYGDRIEALLSLGSEDYQLDAAQAGEDW